MNFNFQIQYQDISTQEKPRMGNWLLMDLFTSKVRNPNPRNILRWSSGYVRNIRVADVLADAKWMAKLFLDLPLNIIMSQNLAAS